MDSLDRYFFKFQSQLLAIDLQLAEAEEKPKRSGEFETSYKNESGKEIVVKRSPDGKFASKNGTSTSSIAAKPNNGAQADLQVARENGKAVREILTGKTGDDLKRNLAAEFEHRPILKEAIEKVDLAEVTAGDADALTNVSKFMSEKFEQALNASSMLAREILGAAVGVAGFVARSLMYSAAFGATLILGSAGIGVFKKGMRPDKALIQQTSAISPAVLRSMFSKESLIRRMKVGAIVEGVFRSLDIASEGLGKTRPPMVEPDADKAVRDTIRGIGGAALKNNLIAGASSSPGIVEGIKNTTIEDTIAGDKDPFSNAVDFLQTKITEAATAVSENKKEIAIGASAVALAVAVTSLGTVTGTLTGATIASTVSGLIAGKGFTEAIKLGLTRLTPAGAKALFSNPIIGRLSEYAIIQNAVNEIKQQVEDVRLARNGGQGAKSFGKKEEAVKKTLSEEGIDYEKVLAAISRKKEEPPDRKKAVKIQKDILELEREIQGVAVKVRKITQGKLTVNPIEMMQILGEVKKEAELRNRIIEKRADLDVAEGRGFSLAKRVNELTDIAKTKGKESPSYKWRSSIIKAELQYGEKLDGLNSLGGYGKLSEAMKKPQPASGGYNYTNFEDEAAFSQIFKISNSPVLSSVDNQSSVLKSAQKEGVELQNYLSTPVNAQIGINGGLTCAFPGGNNKYSEIIKAQTESASSVLDRRAAELLVNTEMFKNKDVDGYINIGDVAIANAGLKVQGYNALASTKEHTREMIWHESGHLLEVKLGKVEESVAFREERAEEVPNDRKVSPQQGLSLGSQDYALGEFYSPYVGLRMRGQGKYANTDRGTEVLSSGMELLSSPTLAKRAVKADRETMLYALAAMNEKK